MVAATPKLLIYKELVSMTPPVNTYQSQALWVPSYVEPAEPNLLINPNHPRISEVTLVVERDPFEFDPRLI